MSFHCHKKLIRYQFCGHDASPYYEHCDGEHDDTNEKNEECWKSQDKKKNLSTQMATTMDNGDNHGQWRGVLSRL
jgi:hypothetical protein